ncbi:MAG: glycosyltransferase family 2 protein [Solirubrobacteraceae bacterium]
MIRGALARALDWRFGAVIARLDELSERVRRIEASLPPAERPPEPATIAAALHELARDARKTSDDALATRRLLEGRVAPMLRALVDEEAENRRRLFALRADPSYEAAYSDPDPLVSVTVATWQHTDGLLQRALPSLLAQTHGNLELLVVGDAAAPEVAERVVALGDPRVHYANLTQRITGHVDAERHWWVSSTMARNEAARRARGRWLLHFDDDDHLRPDAIASLLELARAEHAEVAYGGFDIHRRDGQVTETLCFPPQPMRFGWQGALLHGGLRFFERELIAAALELPGDVYMLERALRAGVRFAMLDQVVWDYYPSHEWQDAGASE